MQKAIFFIVVLIQVSCGNGLTATVDSEYMVNVDCTKTLEEMIDAGNFTSVDPNITSTNFPTNEVECRDVPIALFNFHEWVTTDEVLDEFDEVHARAAKLFEILALAAKHPDLQRKSYIIALGTKWIDSDKSVYYPVLVGDQERRELILVWDEPGGGWFKTNRFAGEYE